MSAILLALTVAGACPEGIAGQDSPLAPPSRPDACAALARTNISHYGRVPLKKLGELPMGLPQHAVLREIGGCSVADVIYQGRTVYVIPQGPRGTAPATIQPLSRPAGR